MKPVLILLLLCSNCFGQRYPLLNPSETHAQIVVVECWYHDSVNHGSGILIDDRTCLTALHCVRNDSLKVIYKGRELIADVLKVHYRNDWAMLRTRDKTDAKPITIRSQPLASGDSVIAYGFGGEIERDKKRLFYWSSKFNGKQLQGTQPIPCDSGGPVFDTDGKLVSIVCDYLDGTQLWNGYGIKENELQTFVKRINE